MSALTSINIDTTYPNNNKPYKAYLVKMMTFLDNEAYSPDQTFPTEKLGRSLSMILASQILHRWPSQRKHYHQHLPMKKAILHFIFNHCLDWDDMNMTGHPTKSAVVNEIIVKVKKMKWGGRGSLTSSISTWVGGVCHDANCGKMSLHRKQPLFDDACGFDLSVAADWLYWWHDETGEIYPQF